MKKYLICFVVLLAAVLSEAQMNEGTQLRNGLLTLITDATTGFPKTFGSLQKDSRYGREYKALRGIFDSVGTAYVYYTAPREQTKYASAEPETFRFMQWFKPESSHYQVVKDSLEKILDEISKLSGVKKEKVELSKAMRKSYDSYYYLVNGTRMFAYEKYKPTGQITVSIYSPYRPGDISAPLMTLGCMVISYPGFNFIYAAPVYGQSAKEVGDIKTLAAKVYYASGLSDNNYQYTWYAGYTFYDIEKRFKKPFIVKSIPGVNAQ